MSRAQYRLAGRRDDVAVTHRRPSKQEGETRDVDGTPIFGGELPEWHIKQLSLITFGTRVKLLPPHLQTTDPIFRDEAQAHALASCSELLTSQNSVQTGKIIKLIKGSGSNRQAQIARTIFVIWTSDGRVQRGIPANRVMLLGAGGGNSETALEPLVIGLNVEVSSEQSHGGCKYVPGIIEWVNRNGEYVVTSLSDSDAQGPATKEKRPAFSKIHVDVPRSAIRNGFESREAKRMEEEEDVTEGRNLNMQIELDSVPMRRTVAQWHESRQILPLHARAISSSVDGHRARFQLLNLAFEIFAIAWCGYGALVDITSGLAVWAWLDTDPGSSFLGSPVFMRSQYENACRIYGAEMITQCMLLRPSLLVPLPAQSQSTDAFQANGTEACMPSFGVAGKFQPFFLMEAQTIGVGRGWISLLLAMQISLLVFLFWLLSIYAQRRAFPSHPSTAQANRMLPRQYQHPMAFVCPLGQLLSDLCAPALIWAGVESPSGPNGAEKTWCGEAYLQRSSGSSLMRIRESLGYLQMCVVLCSGCLALSCGALLNSLRYNCLFLSETRGSEEFGMLAFLTNPLALRNADGDNLVSMLQGMQSKAIFHVCRGLFLALLLESSDSFLHRLAAVVPALVATCVVLAKFFASAALLLVVNRVAAEIGSFELDVSQEIGIANIGFTLVLAVVVLRIAFRARRWEWMRRRHQMLGGDVDDTRMRAALHGDFGARAQNDALYEQREQEERAIGMIGAISQQLGNLCPTQGFGLLFVFSSWGAFTCNLVLQERIGSSDTWDHHFNIDLGFSAFWAVLSISLPVLNFMIAQQVQAHKERTDNRFKVENDSFV